MKTYLNILMITALIVVAQVQRLAAQNSFSLTDCINYAWENSTDIGRANNAIKSESAYLEQAKAARGPNLFLNANQNTSSSNSYLSAGNESGWARDSQSNLNVSLNSSMTLYNGAKLKNTITQSQTNLAAAETDIQTEKDWISLNILSAYINVLLAKENVQNSEAQLQSTEKQLEYAEARQTAGIISRGDYLNIKSQYASQKASLVSVQSNLRISLVSLMQLMNMPVDADFEIADPDLQTLLNQKIETDADNIYNIALDIRPEIKSAELDLESAHMGVNIAKSAALPSLTLNGSLASGYNDNLTAVNFNNQMSNQITPSVGLSLSIPIYQRKQAKTQVEQATIQADNIEYNLIDTKNNLRKAIEQASTNARTAQMTFAASQEQYEAEEESYRLAEEMFAQGLVNSVDFLTSKNNLITAENNLTQSKYNVALQHKIIDYYLGKPITL